MSCDVCVAGERRPQLIRYSLSMADRLILVDRRVSSTLRHPAWEFSDFLPLSFGRVAPAC